MTRSMRKAAVLYGVGLLLVAAVSSVLFSGAGGLAMAAGNGSVSLSCVGDGGGAAYVTDSGLTAYENDSNVSYGSFGDDGNSVTFGETTLSAAGNASVRVDDTDPYTCLGSVQVGDDPITVVPGSAAPVVLESNVSRFAYRDPVFSADDTGADLAFEGTGPVSVTLQSTGLEEGTMVRASAAETGATLDSATVNASGALSFEIAAGTHRVDLSTYTPTPTSTPTRTSSSTQTSGPEPTATDIPTPVPTATPTATRIPTATATPTPVPTATPRPTPTSTTAAPPTSERTSGPAPTSSETSASVRGTSSTPMATTDEQTTTEMSGPSDVESGLLTLVALLGVALAALWRRR